MDDVKFKHRYEQAIHTAVLNALNALKVTLKRVGGARGRYHSHHHILKSRLNLKQEIRYFNEDTAELVRVTHRKDILGPQLQSHQEQILSRRIDTALFPEVGAIVHDRFLPGHPPI